MGMILRIASSRIVGQGDIVGRSGYFSLNLSANSVMRGRLDARRTLKSLVADLRFIPFHFLFTISRLLNQSFLTVFTHPLAGLLIIFEAAFTETAKHALQELADNPEYQQYNYNISHKSYFYSFNNNKNTK